MYVVYMSYREYLYIVQCTPLCGRTLQLRPCLAKPSTEMDWPTLPTKMRMFSGSQFLVSPYGHVYKVQSSGVKAQVIPGWQLTLESRFFHHWPCAQALWKIIDPVLKLPSKCSCKERCSSVAHPLRLPPIWKMENYFNKSKLLTWSNC